MGITITTTITISMVTMIPIRPTEREVCEEEEDEQCGEVEEQCADVEEDCRFVFVYLCIWRNSVIMLKRIAGSS